jgi:hypothetical protein
MKTVIEMAHEAGFHSPVRADGYMGLAYDRREGRETGGSLERFAELVRADERGQCLHAAEVAASLLNDPIAAIRARSNT